MSRVSNDAIAVRARHVAGDSMTTDSIPTERDEIVLHFPFDIGHSYIFHARARNRKYLTDGELLEVWEGLFRKRKEPSAKKWKWAWEGAVAPESFENPLGFMAKAQIPDGEDLRAATTRIDWIDKSTLSAEVIVFPLGIGMLSVSGKLKDISAKSALKKFWKSRPEVTKEFACILEDITQEIRDIWIAAARKRPYIEDTPNNRRVLFELRDLRRVKPIKKVKFSFPLIFSSDAAEFEEIHNSDGGYFVPGITFDPEKRVICYFNSEDEGTRVSLGWSEACALKASASAKEKIRTIFVIAMTSWFALTVMKKMASAYLLEAFRDMATKEPRILKKKGRTMRLTFMDAASASRPIRWATTPQDLLLLEAIHTSWRSDLLFKHIEEQTLMLATHHDQIETEEKEWKGAILGILGVVIAGFTFATALEDSSKIWGSHPHVREWVEQNGGLLSMIFAIMLMILVGCIHNRTRLNEARKGEGSDGDEYESPL
jgi:hypothetical protein